MSDEDLVLASCQAQSDNDPSLDYLLENEETELQRGREVNYPSCATED